MLQDALKDTLVKSADLISIESAQETLLQAYQHLEGNSIRQNLVDNIDLISAREQEGARHLSEQELLALPRSDLIASMREGQKADAIKERIMEVDS